MLRHAYRLHSGSLSKMKLVEEQLPDPGPGEATIAVKAIGLNFADIFAIWGLYSATPAGEFVPGLEYAGVVARVGAGVTHLREGDEVMGVIRFGAYATHLNIDARYVLPLPPGWSFEEGAAYPVQALTAYYSLKELGTIRQSHTVLIHSAAGGVGIGPTALLNSTVPSPACPRSFSGLCWPKPRLYAKGFGRRRMAEEGPQLPPLLYANVKLFTFLVNLYYLYTVITIYASKR